MKTNLLRKRLKDIRMYVCIIRMYVRLYACMHIYIYISKYRVQGLDTSFWPRCRKRSCAGNSVSPSFCSTGNDVSSLSTDTSHILMLSSLFRVWDLGFRLLLNWQRRLFPLERHVPYTYPRPWIYIHIYIQRKRQTGHANATKKNKYGLKNK